MSDLRYTRKHEWVSMDGDVATVGISDFAQDQLGDVVFVELPEPGRLLARGEQAAVVESVKAASELYAPVSGEVVEINQSLEDDPSQVNADATGTGWFVKIRIARPEELAGLMDEAAYTAFTSGQG